MLVPPTMADVQSPLYIDWQASWRPVSDEEKAVRIVILAVRISPVFGLQLAEHMKYPRPLEVDVIGDPIRSNVVTVTGDAIHVGVLSVLCFHVDPVFAKYTNIAANVPSSPVVGV